MRDYRRIIEEPLLMEQANPGSFKDFEWYEISRSVQRCLSDEQHREELHQLMQPFYTDYIYARPSYNDGLYTKKRFIHDVLEKDDLAKRWVQREVNLVMMTSHWISSKGREEEFVELLVQLCNLGYTTVWSEVHQQIYELLRRLEVEGTRKGDTDAGKYYCLLHGFAMIMGSDLSSKRKQNLLNLFMSHWDFLRYVYSVMLRCIVGCRFTNFVSVANNVANTAADDPYLHLFYVPLIDRFDDLCMKGTKKEKLEKSVMRLEEKMKQVTPSNELDELCELLFPDEFRDMLNRHRPKSYLELEGEINHIKQEMQGTIQVLNEQINALAAQLSAAVKAAVPIIEIEHELLRFPSQQALPIFMQLNTLLMGNVAWTQASLAIRDKILDKQKEELRLSMSITAQAGSNVNGVVQQQANYGIEPNRQIPS